jgi:dihydropteroate synthase
MLYKPLDLTPIQSLNATTAANVLALQKGSNILRVHDVKEAMECIKVFELSS